MKQTLILILTFAFLSINSNAQNNIDLNALPSVSDLSAQVTNPTADTIILYSNGGPMNFMDTTEFPEFNSISTFSVVYVEQYQHYNPSIMNDSSLTLQDAIIYNDTSVAILKKVVNHYNNLGKKVVIIGHSFGAFIIAEYLDDYGNSDVHKIIPMAGRLNMNDTIWQSFATGYSGGFLSDGITTTIDASQASSADWAMMKLMAGCGYNRHIDSLAGLDLSNLMYLYGESDEAVGRLLPNEVSFLKNANATVVAVPNGDHGSMFTNAYMNQVLAFIRGTSIVGIEDNLTVMSKVKVYPTIIQNQLNVVPEKEGRFMVCNAQGQLMFDQNLSAGYQTINLSHLNSGIHFITYIDKNNVKTNQKIIKQ